MKNLFLFTILGGVMGVLFSCTPAVTEDTTSKDTERRGIAAAAGNSIPCIFFKNTDEDSIHISKYIIADSHAEDQRFMFKNHFRYAADSKTLTLNTSENVLKAYALVDLYQRVKAVPADIRGIKIYLGLENGRIAFYIRNVVMKCSGAETTPAIYEYTPAEIGSIYKLNPTTHTLEEVPDLNDFTASINNYVSNIRIKHRTGDAYYTEMNQTTNDWRLDTKSIIFSYQELFRYYQISSPCKDGMSSYEQDLYFYSGGVFKNQNDAFVEDQVVVKHSVVIANRPLSEASFKGPRHIFEAANLAHLCPPSCKPKFHIIAKFPCGN